MTAVRSSNKKVGFLPPRWFIRQAWKAHRGLYRWSGGLFGLQAATAEKEGLALLTTIGRKSGVEREVMIGYYADGDNYVTMAMNGWDPAEPQWWLNLQANPEATLTVKSGAIAVVAEKATDDDRDRLWDRWRELDKFVDRHSSRRTDGTDVVIFKPAPVSERSEVSGL